MNLDFTEDEIMLRTMARDFLVKECPKTLVREIEESQTGYSPAIWGKMAELGWQGMIIPRQYGGSEMPLFYVALVIEEMGRNILPSPFLSTVVCASAILEAGTERQKSEFLPKVAEGRMILSLALTEPSASWKPEHVSFEAKLHNGHYVLNGTKLFVPDAHVADYLLVVVRTDKRAGVQEGITLLLVDAKNQGIECKPQPTIALDNKCEVAFTDVAVLEENILGTVNEGWGIVESMLKKAMALKVAEISGGCQACLEMTRDYVKERTQYGRTIGSFQAIQHYLADMWGDVDRTKAIALEVNWKVSAGLATRLDVAAAKGWANEAYKRVAEMAVQCHGAIGTTRDHDIGLYFRRSKSFELDYGDTDYQREIVTREIGF